MPTSSNRLYGLLLASATCVVAFPSHADSGWYAGASAGEAYMEVDVEGADNVFGFDEGDFAYKLFGGYVWDLPVVNLGVEAGYVDLANPVADFPDFRADFSPTGFNLWGVAGFTIGPVSLFGKLGALAWDIEGETRGAVNRDFDNSGTDLGYGVGATVELWSVQFRAEYESYDIADTENVEMFSLGVAWLF